MIYGNIEGIRKSVLIEMEQLYELEFEPDEFLPEVLMDKLAQYSELFNREVMVYLSRYGEVIEITVGSLESVPLSAKRMRRNPNRLSGIRCIHTHPGGNPELSTVDEQALRMMKFDAMCAIGVKEGKPTGVCAGFLGDMVHKQFEIVRLGPVKPNRIPQMLWMEEIERAEQRVQAAGQMQDNEPGKERALLVTVDSEESMEELAGLADTAGAMVIERVLQKRMKPDGATYIGSGKAEELALVCQAQEIDVVIVDDELTGAQVRNLEEILGVRVIDRTTLILDIFAQRAQSKEGKLQVELAQMRYRLPRLIGLGTVLSRLGGGIGTRGPGETQLEADRRRIRRRIVELERDLKEVSRQRNVRRSRRQKGEQTVVALVGYTNTGKSTLLNTLSGSEVLAEDKLFATLDPVTRRVQMPDNSQILLVDTVGFIRKLPHDLVEAFKSTLEEAMYADLLLIVSDASSAQYHEQRKVVGEVLAELGASDKPVLEVLNKTDRASAEAVQVPGAIRISAATGAGLDELKQAILKKVDNLRHKVRLLIPYSKGGLLSMVHDQGQILSQEYDEQGTRIECVLDAALYQRLAKQLAPDQIELI